MARSFGIVGRRLEGPLWLQPAIQWGDTLDKTSRASS